MKVINFLILLVLTMSSVSHADETDTARARAASKFQYLTEGSATGFKDGPTCDRALKNALENAASICEEKGQALGETEVSGCGYESSMFGFSKRVHEIAFNCR